ncbi:MAG: xanthine dehydrogenase family protein molybdopterin-binding subunit [Rhodoplanes sp.]|uniref:xanthine dehydrogenase family protein molybdopterin-binding subunit n=1 Tax=Rhodoplanes sp. TaxID=1968906 RepID=UPI0017CA9C54|nr:molybdopterin cofactor-binding domain-containing protein [Rhodoplanes sp.]NVO13206.1 xanthine dehydrogenase family protein molybdopterin-binding subunit [Rhodoplanes sp.]
MTTSQIAPNVSRRALLKGGALTVGFVLGGGRLEPIAVLAQGAAQAAAPARVLDPKEVDAYLAVNGDGTVTVWCGKVDLGQGLRVAIPQIAAEELGIGLDKITYIEGDTALTPDQGRTAGSYGIARGGMQIRQAAATARKALVEIAAQRLGVPAETLVAEGGAVRPKAGGTGLGFAELIGGKRFDLKLDPKAPVRDPATYTLVGKPLPRPDVPAKCTGTLTYVHDFAVPGMLHARMIRPPALGAHLVAVDEASVAGLAGVRVVHIKDFLAVVAADEWTAVKAARALKAQWTEGSGLPAQDQLPAVLKASPGATEQVLVTKGAEAPRPDGAKTLQATYFWPMQSHASIGPSCAVADVKPDSATVWTASQGTHGNQDTFARFLKLPKDKVRLIYLDGAGCYGMNGHEDAAADAAVLSRAVGAPVRVQWSREDELGWDPKGPAQLIDIAGAIDAAGKIRDWRTDMWIPENTRGLPSIPLLAPEAAGLDQMPGLNSGQIAQNGDPPYRTDRVQVVAHWLKTSPLRPAPLRSPGKPANCFAVESFLDELAAAAGLDPLALRLQGLTNPRGIAVVEQVAQMMSWQARPSPGPGRDAPVGRGRGIAYIHYKHEEAHVAIGMDVAVERSSGAIKVERVACAHDCGQIINPDGVRAQVEGSILQTLSRVLMEEVRFDQKRVTSTDWSSYPLLTFSDVPKLDIVLIDRPTDPPLGAGEAACAPVGAALANAVFDATGARLRTVPFTPERVKAALGGQAATPRT